MLNIDRKMQFFLIIMLLAIILPMLIINVHAEEKRIQKVREVHHSTGAPVGSISVSEAKSHLNSGEEYQSHYVYYAGGTNKIRITYFVTIRQVKGANDEIPKAWNIFMEEINVMVAGIYATALLTSYLVFIVQMIQLAILPSHPIKRRQAVVGMVVSGITLMLLGGIGLIKTIIFQMILL